MSGKIEDVSVQRELDRKSSLLLRGRSAFCPCVGSEVPCSPPTAPVVPAELLVSMQAGSAVVSLAWPSGPLGLGDPFAVTISHIFLLLMTLTVFRSTGQEFCAESLNLGLSRFVFFTINSGLGEEDHSGYDLWLPMLTLIT